MSASALSCGSLLSRACAIGFSGSAGDRLFQAFWLGLLALGYLLLTISLFAPTGGWIGTLALAAPVLAACAWPKVRGDIRRLLADTGWHAAAPLAVSALIAAAAAIELIVYFDTGQYHFQIVRIMADYGTIPGKALIFENYGFTSSWLALSSPLGLWMPVERSGTVVNGLVTAVVICQVLVSAKRIADGRSTAADWLIVCAMTIAIIALTRWQMIASLTPDLANIVGPIVVAWLMCLPKDGNTSGPERNVFVTGMLLAPAKLSALPVAVVATLFYWWRLGRSPRTAVLLLAVAFTTAAPLFAAFFIGSGCVIFPMYWTCFDVDWSLPVQNVRVLSAIITDSARHSLSSPGGWWGDLLNWASNDRSGSTLFAIFLASGAGLALRARKMNLHSFAGPIALSLAGALYVSIFAPTGRFACGYLLIVPACFVTTMVQNRLADLQFPKSSVGGIAGVTAFASVATSAAFLLSAVSPAAVERRHAMTYAAAHNVDGFDTSPLLLPPPVLPFDQSVPGPIRIHRLKPEQLRDFSVTFPEGHGTCWAAEPFCTKRPAPVVGLRKPDIGPRAGFIRHR